MSNIKTYRPNNIKRSELSPAHLVRAVQVTEKNLITVKDWAGQYVPVEAKIDVSSKTGDSSNHRVKVKTPKGWRVAKVGDWLIRQSTPFTHTETAQTASVFTVVVGKDEFLKEHTETTYKAEFDYNRGSRKEHTRKSA